MHVITRKRLSEFWELYPMSAGPLVAWYSMMHTNDFRSFSEVRRVFPSADQVGKLTIFNLGGNKYRLIAAIHYNRKRIYIRAVLTHEEYDKGRWKE